MLRARGDAADGLVGDVEGALQQAPLAVGRFALLPEQALARARRGATDGGERPERAPADERRTGERDLARATPGAALVPALAA